MTTRVARRAESALATLTIAATALSAPTSGAESEAREPTELPQVQVIAPAERDGPSLTAPTPEIAKERIEKTPGGAGIVNAEIYRAGRVSSLEDTFRYAPGVFAQPRFGAEETRLSIRGSGIQRTFHLRGILLLQDGTPLNLADGSGDFQTLEPLATRYIEVWRGANALRYGSATLGGAINYESYTGYTATPVMVRAEAGSFDYLRTQLAGSQTFGTADYYASLSTFDQEGFRRHAEQESQRVFANTGFRLSNDVETRFYLTATRSNSELPGNLTRAQLEDDPRQANPSNVANDQRRDVDYWRFANRTVFRFGAARVEVAAWYFNYRLFHPIFQVFKQDADQYGGDVRLVYGASLAGHRNEFVAGLRPQRGVTNEDRFLNVAGQAGARTDQSNQIATNLALYVENYFYAATNVALIAGLQYTRSTRNFVDRFTVGADQSFDLRYTATSPKVGILYEWSPHIQFFANVSKSFEPPSFGELTGGPNPVLNAAQKAWTYEVGTRGTLPAIGWDLALYHADVRDELLGTLAAGSATLTVNVPRTIHEGIELATFGTIVKGLEWRQTLLVNRFRFDDDPDFGNNTLPGLPKVFFTGELLYRAANGFYGGPNVTWSPQEYPVDMANTLFADSYVVWGLRIGQTIGRRWSWFVEGRNLADKRYAAATGVIRNANSVDDPLNPQFLPGDGRSFYAGLQWQL